MNNDDMSEIIQKLNCMMNNSENNNCSNDNSSENGQSFENFQDFFSSFNSSMNNEDDCNNNINFDFDTILKIKNIMDKFNSYKSGPDVKLLMSLKPFLNNSRSKKIDQYIQFLNIAKILESFNSEGEVNIK